VFAYTPLNLFGESPKLREAPQIFFLLKLAEI
jgi:hypothetical protein